MAFEKTNSIDKVMQESNENAIETLKALRIKTSFNLICRAAFIIPVEIKYFFAHQRNGVYFEFQFFLSLSLNIFAIFF